MQWAHVDGDVESFDYDLFESRVNKSGLEYQYRDGQERTRLVVARWCCTMLIGIATAVVAIILLSCTMLLGNFKTHLLQDSIHREKLQTVDSGYAFRSLALFNLVLVFGAVSLTTFGERIAAGSGISEIKSVLNGVKIPRVLRLSTLVCKVLGTICSVSAGLPVGKEGPMIHSGAIMGAGLSQGKSSTVGYDTSFTYFAGFRNDHEKRDFVACGAAAGVAAAFGAPIGGVLFVLEEGASFWKQELTWRTFFCAMMATFTLTLFISGLDRDSHWGTLGSRAGTFSFGGFEASTYEAWEVPIFILMGVGGGIFGALFNATNTRITRLRSRWITTNPRFILEALFVSFVVSSLSFGLPFVFGTCLQRPDVNDVMSSSNATYPYRKEMIGFYCSDPTNQHNDLATLFLSSGEGAIKQLFHAPPGSFEVRNLLLFATVSLFLACWTYGLKVPSGLFVPALLIGAAYGRLWTRIVNATTQSIGWKMVDARTYGLVGSAAMLGGITRMTISVTVILLECTGNIQYGLPLITTFFAARFIGNYFNEGIYDIHIHLGHLPFLDWNPPLLGTFLRVKHVMARNPKCLRPIERVGNVYDILSNTTHNGFPVVDKETSFFKGIVLRKQLSVLLARQDFLQEKPLRFSRTPPDDSKIIDPSTKCLSYRDMEGNYPRYPRVSDSSISETQRHLWIDLTPYMNRTPHLIHEEAPFTRAYRLFRNSGLRHLVVVDSGNHVRGIITRRDLEADHCSRCFRLASLANEVVYPASPALIPRRPSRLRHTVERRDQVMKALQQPFLLDPSMT